MNLISRLIKEESGQGMVEYGLIIALVAVAAIATLGFLGTSLSDIFDGIKDKLTGITVPE